MIESAAASLPLLSALPRLRCGSTCHRATEEHSQGWDNVLYQFNASVSLQSLMALLGHISATMSLRYGRLFDATGKAEYEGTDRGERPPPGHCPPSRTGGEPRRRTARHLRRCRHPRRPRASDPLPQLRPKSRRRRIPRPRTRSPHLHRADHRDRAPASPLWTPSPSKSARTEEQPRRLPHRNQRTDS